jgi:hypothetical protein
MQLADCWFASVVASCVSWLAANSEAPTGDVKPLPDDEDGNAVATCCDHSASLWSTALSQSDEPSSGVASGIMLLGTADSGGSTTDVPPWPSLDAVKFASE